MACTHRRDAYGKTAGRALKNALQLTRRSTKKNNLSQIFDKRFNALTAGGVSLGGGLKGIEKEALRLDLDGYLSRKPHPAGLGSALTNRFITTDFSEALLEFVTPVYSSTWEALRFLCDVHQFTYECLDDELLWIASMPCRIPADAEIPLARYGKSNVGQMKTIYRRGLGVSATDVTCRRLPEFTSTIHFPNHSGPVSGSRAEDAGDEQAFRSNQYLGLIRNFRRFGWLTLYLFGASPAMCKSFGSGADIGMQELSDDTWYAPFGTSLRMSDLGYSNQNQSRINISLNNLDDYIRDLQNALNTPEPDYEEYRRQGGRKIPAVVGQPIADRK